MDKVIDALEAASADIARSRRSPMIQALDDSEWRWSLEVFHASEADKWLTRQMRADGVWEPSWLSGRLGPSEMIRLLDDPAWRESLKVAETPVEAEYAGVRERLEAMRPAPAGFYSARTGYEGEYRQFFGFRS